MGIQSLVLQTGVIRQGKAVEEWIKTLNELGMEGWELVAVIPMQVQLGFAGSTPQIRCFLKREIKNNIQTYFRNISKLRKL